MSIVADYPSGLTWDEFLALPHETRNAALIDGEVVANPPNANHEQIVGNLQFVFKMWLRAGIERGDVSTQQPVKINDERGYQPDFMWYPPEHCAPPDQPASFSGPPSLIVEVLSPSTRSFDLVRKRADYDHIGIRELWIIDPRKQKVIVCRRRQPDGPYVDTELGRGDTITSPLLEALEVPVDELYSR